PRPTLSKALRREFETTRADGGQARSPQRTFFGKSPNQHYQIFIQKVLGLPQSVDLRVLRRIGPAPRPRPIRSLEGAGHHGDIKTPIAFTTLHSTQRSRTLRPGRSNQRRARPDSRCDLRSLPR